MSTQTPETVEEELVTEAASTGEQKCDAKKYERTRHAQEQREAEAVEKTRSADDTCYLKVFHYDLEVPKKQEPHFDDFHVPYKQGMTIFDALVWARDHYSSSLTSRHPCRQVVCGFDVPFVNGSQRLGCKTQLSDLSEPIRVEPLPYSDVVEDLVASMEHSYDQMESVEPYPQTNSLPDGELDEQRQTRGNREKVKTSTHCTWCSACMSPCNIAAGDNEHLGPVAISKVYRFAMDEREGEDIKQHRLEILKREHGIQRCQTQFSCTEMCSKDIPLMEHIQEFKCETIRNNLRSWRASR